jgi:hypothetical protein
MRPHQKEAFLDLAESLAESADPDPARKWLLGLTTALALAGYGVYCLLTQRAWVLQTRPLRIHEWQGTSALALGCLLVATGAFLHCHWFWNSHPRWHGWGEIGKLPALLGIIASLAWLLYEALFANLL